MSNTITLPAAGELELNIESELHKLPSEAAHNHFHNLAENADKIQEQAKTMSLVALIFCALELEHVKKENKAKGNTEGASVLPWKKWVGENCEFTYMTATRYAKVIKCARAGMLDGLDKDLVPSIAYSQMSADEQQDASKALADGLQGYGSRRQLYLALDILKTPQRQTIDENRQKKGELEGCDEEGTAEEGTAEEQPDLKKKIDLDKQDAVAAIEPTLKPLDDYFKLNKHTHLERADLERLDQCIQAYRDLLKPLLK